MLDAYARLFPTKGLTVTAGQMRVPFTIDEMCIRDRSLSINV